MKLGKLFIYGCLVVATIISGCTSISNPPLKLEGKSGIVNFSKSAFESLVDKQLSDDQFPILRSDGRVIPYQFLNSESSWESVIYYIPTGDEFFNVTYVPYAELPACDKVVNVRLGIKPDYVNDFSAKRLKTTDSPSSSAAFQMEGPAWENDKVAFRNYYDARNGIDIFGKRTPKMMLDSVGREDFGTYHELADWGMDILKVGNSLGAGALALKIGDSLYRVGPNSDGAFKIIEQTPLKLIFALTFDNWTINEYTYQLEHKISIQGGNRFYESEVSIVSDNPDKNYSLSTGLVNLHNDSLYNWSLNDQAIYATYDGQAFDGEKLGMAISCDPTQVSATEWAPEEGEGIIQTHLIHFKVNDNQPYKFKVWSCWEYENESFKTLEGTRELVQGFFNK